jgi:hypothetical protein
MFEHLTRHNGRKRFPWEDLGDLAFFARYFTDVTDISCVLRMPFRGEEVVVRYQMRQEPACGGSYFQD